MLWGKWLLKTSYSYHHFVFIATHSEDDEFLNKWAHHESEWLHEKAIDCIPLSWTWLVTTRRKRFHLVISFWHTCSVIQILNETTPTPHWFCTWVIQAGWPFLATVIIFGNWICCTYSELTKYSWARRQQKCKWLYSADKYGPLWSAQLLRMKSSTL